MKCFAARYFSDFKCQADDIGALAQKKVRRDAARQCLAWTCSCCVPVYIYTPSFTHCHRPSFTHHLSHTTLSHALFHTHNFHTGNLSHTTLSHTHTIFLCHTPSFTHNFVTHTHPIFLCHTPTFTCNFVIHNLHHLLCLSFLPRPCYNISCPLLEEVDLWGYPVL